jgi:glycosyltransferase involved in cell wall biosynthesis
MIDLSVIIPSRNSGGTNFCSKTIEDILAKSETNIEVIVNVDEAWPTPLVEDTRIHYIHPPTPQGLRSGVNAGVRMSKGKYIMKIDDHCLVGQGFDKILIDNHLDDRWVQIPRRYSLDAENWKINETRPFRDYMYIDFPKKGKAHDDGMHGVEWFERQKERTDSRFDIDDTPSLQGSCYFMSRNHFMNNLKELDPTNYGQFAQESQEIGFKTWLMGGALKVNKKTYYAHLHKGKQYGRMYKLDDQDHKRGANWSAEHWLNDREPNMKYKFEYFIDTLFPNMPSWPKDWKEQIRSMGWTQ